MTRVDSIRIIAQAGDAQYLGKIAEELSDLCDDLQRQLQAALLEAETQRQLAALAEKRWSGLLDAWNHYAAEQRAGQ